MNNNTLNKYEPALNKYEPKSEMICLVCSKKFKLIKLYQTLCSEACENSVSQKMQEIEDKKLNKICIRCNLHFRAVSEKQQSNICDGCKHQKAYLDYKNRYVPKETKKKRGRSVSYDELNKRSEYKRVFDDIGWKHYLKGRKWDRI